MVGDMKRSGVLLVFLRGMSSKGQEDFAHPELLLRRLLTLVVTSDRGPIMIEVQCRG